MVHVIIKKNSEENITRRFTINCIKFLCEIRNPMVTDILNQVRGKLFLWTTRKSTATQLVNQSRSKYLATANHEEHIRFLMVLMETVDWWILGRAFSRRGISVTRKKTLLRFIRNTRSLNEMNYFLFNVESLDQQDSFWRLWSGFDDILHYPWIYLSTGRLRMLEFD